LIIFPEEKKKSLEKREGETLADHLSHHLFFHRKGGGGGKERKKRKGHSKREKGLELLEIRFPALGRGVGRKEKKEKTAGG